MTDEMPRRGQPAVFWIGMGVGALFVGFQAARLVLGDPGRWVWVVALLVGGLAVAPIAWVVVWFILRDRVKILAKAFPNAIHVPIVVGNELAPASGRIAAAFSNDTRIKLRWGSYAALAFDAEGAHIAPDSASIFGLIPADRFRVAGFDRSMLGIRAMTSVKLQVMTDEGVVDFAFVPVRLKAIPFRQLSQRELRTLSQNITRASAGEAVEAGWPY